MVLQHAVLVATVCRRVSFKFIIFPLKSSAQQYTLYAVSALRPDIVELLPTVEFVNSTWDPNILISKIEVIFFPGRNDAQ
jgi:hypothetical protein